MKLLNEDTDFRISTTGAVAEYSDDGELTIGLCAQTKGCISDEIFSIEINFKYVAEFICRTINFYEANYEEFEIVDCNGCKSERKEISGFYRVLDSQLLKSCNKKYDPKDRFNLKHFLVTGGDGYFEILASSYSVRKLPPE